MPREARGSGYLERFSISTFLRLRTRLRAAGVWEEDRAAIIGQATRAVPEHYAGTDVGPPGETRKLGKCATLTLWIIRSGSERFELRLEAARGQRVAAVTAIDKVHVVSVVGKYDAGQQCFA